MLLHDINFSIAKKNFPTTCFTEIAEVVQNVVLPFFENSLKCVCFCLIIALFDYQYHWTRILCEVEEQATCMPMSLSYPSNSGHL